ncbi:MAG TPA: VOC family protein [Candidatus Hydrogenedentes bacterium]|nr:VOC family protein [Candidatus Hydrogenedentota bacterium]HPG69333.1 VOC family protein [Candidatus Hydrogenedentota bacterium]
MPTLDHVALQVSDMDAAVRFYAEGLGLRLLSRQEDREHGEVFAFFELNGGNLELLQMIDAEGHPRAMEAPPIRRPYCPHVAVRTDDMDAQLAALEANGVPVAAGPFIIEGSVRWVYVHDLDNNIIEYVQWL